MDIQNDKHCGSMHDYHPLADHITKLQNITKGKICEFSAFLFSFKKKVTVFLYYYNISIFYNMHPNCLASTLVWLNLLIFMYALETNAHLITSRHWPPTYFTPKISDLDIIWYVNVYVMFGGRITIFFHIECLHHTFTNIGQCLNNFGHKCQVLA